MTYLVLSFKVHTAADLSFFLLVQLTSDVPVTHQIEKFTQNIMIIIRPHGWKIRSTDAVLVSQSKTRYSTIKEIIKEVGWACPQFFYAIAGTRICCKVHNYRFIGPL